MTPASAARSAFFKRAARRIAAVLSTASMASATVFVASALWVRLVPLPAFVGIGAAVLFAAICIIAVYATVPPEAPAEPTAVSTSRAPRHVVRPPPPPTVDILQAQLVPPLSDTADPTRSRVQLADVDRAFANLEEEWHELALLARRRPANRRVLAA